MQSFNLEIITPAKLTLSSTVKSVTVPGTLGEFQVLYNHAPIISTLDVGRIKVIKEDDSVVYFATGGGTIEVLGNKVLVLADSIEEIDAIDVDRAKEALNRAKNRLSSSDKSKIDVARAEAALARAMNRIYLAEKFSKV
jgi:ATP synthase, F1 epsilon subunit (delta in mitochondria)